MLSSRHRIFCSFSQSAISEIYLSRGRVKLYINTKFNILFELLEFILHWLTLRWQTLTLRFEILYSLPEFHNVVYFNTVSGFTANIVLWYEIKRLKIKVLAQEFDCLFPQRNKLHFLRWSHNYYVIPDPILNWKNLNST